MAIATWVKSWMIIGWSILRRDIVPKVVFYHDIGKRWTPMGTDEKIFIKHMKILGSRVKGVGSSGDVVCFDDGFRGLYDYREELREWGLGSRILVKVFVAPRLVGQPGYLTWDEIRVLNREYGIDFQCHTWSHQTLAGPMIDESPKEERTEEWYERELIASKEAINRELKSESVKCKVDELCFPVGNFSDDVIRRCKEAGYKKVYASYPGNLGEGEDEGGGYVQPRCLVQDLGVMGFKAVLNGGMEIFKKRYLKMHKVDGAEK